MSRTLVRGGCVLTLGRTNFAEADVLIEDGVIAEVGPGIRARDAEVVDAEGAIVMPGFVDTHRHAWESLFKNHGDGAAVSPEVVGPHYRPDDVYAATLAGLLGAVEAGVTTVVDCCAAATDPDRLDAALQAHADAGIAGVFVPSSCAWEPDAWERSLRRLADDGQRPRPTIGAAPPGLDRESVETAVSGWALARDLGLRIHAHAGASASSAGAVAAMAERDLLGDDVTLVHCTILDEADLDAAAASGVAVSLTPSADMAGGLGSPPVQALLDRGIRPGLGTGSERFAPGDGFAQMRTVISVQHAAHFELKLAGKAGLPRLLSTRDVITYATIGGARSIGLDAETGTLEPGKRADLVVLRADRPNIHPVNDPIGAVVWGMDTSNVDWVFAGGRALMREGALDADLAEARRRAAESRRAVGEAAGILAPAGERP